MKDLVPINFLEKRGWFGWCFIGVVLIFGLALFFESLLKDHPLITFWMLLFSAYCAYSIHVLQVNLEIKNLNDSKGIKIILIGLVLNLLIARVGAAIAHLENSILNNQFAIENNNINMAPFPFIVSTIIMTPIVEEIIFRYILQGKVLNRFLNPFWGVIASSVLFAASHGASNLGNFIAYGGAGLIQGLIYQKTKNIEYPIAIHALNNALVYILMLLGFSFV